MWLSGQAKGKTEAPAAAQAGFTTLGGGETGVYLDGERRAMAVYAPGGYQWTPMAGQEVLVLKNGGTGAAYCVAAARCSGGGAPGEVTISAGQGGAGIRLRNDGTVELLGKVLVNGAPIGMLGGEGGGGDGTDGA